MDAATGCLPGLLDLFLRFSDPEGPSAQYLRLLVPQTHACNGLGLDTSNIRYLHRLCPSLSILRLPGSFGVHHPKGPKYPSIGYVGFLYSEWCWAVALYLGTWTHWVRSGPKSTGTLLPTTIILR